MTELSASLPAPATLEGYRARARALPEADADARAAAVAREPILTKPPGSLGRLEALAAWLAAWQGRHPPRLETVRAVVFAGNHGVAARGVSAFPPVVTAQMVANFQAGGAAVNQLCAANDVALTVTALDLDHPTADMTEGPALDEAALVAALDRGWESVPADTDLLCVGEMGIGNTTSAAALAAGLLGGTGADWVGPGTGVQGAALTAKAAVVDAALARHRERRADPLAMLGAVGGRELAAMAGAILAARHQRVPVLVDGYVASAAALVWHALTPGALDHCHIAHESAEPGHRALVTALGQRALLHLDMRLGEASGAVLAVALCRAALACHTGMATFAEAGVSGGG